MNAVFFLDVSQTSDDSSFLNTPPGSTSSLGCFPVGFSTGEHLFPYSQQTVPHPAQHGNLILMIHIFDLAFHGQMPLMTQTSRFIWAWDRQLARASRVAGEDVSQTSEGKSRLSLKKREERAAGMLLEVQGNTLKYELSGAFNKLMFEFMLLKTRHTILW